MSRSSAVTSAVIVLTVALATGCSSPPGARGAAGSVESGSTDAADTSELEEFYEQELAFGPCTDYATTEADAKLFGETPVECADLTVPLDYDDPAGRSIEVAVARAEATGERTGSLVVNPGGPASPGTSFAATITKLPGYARIGKNFDIVGFDMRGTGASQPTVDCLSDEERDDAALVATWFFGGETWEEGEPARVAEQCAEGSGGADVISHLGTRDTVQDMDVLRAVLGDDQLNFLGASYGTRLGAVYADTFPERVRSMVLDGGIDPSLGIEERLVQQFAGFQSAFDAMAEACAEAETCPLGTDPAQASSRFQDLVRPLIASPAATAGDRTLSYRDAVEAMLFGLYSPENWEFLIDGLTEVEKGRGDSLLAVRDVAHQRQSDGSYSPFLEAAFATHCNDKERQSAQEETAMRARMLEAAPFMDDGRDLTARDSCEGWPAEPSLDYPYLDDVGDLPRTLVVSVTGDPSAPYEGSTALAEALGADHLTVEGVQHGAVYVAGNTCVDDAVNDYLLDLTPLPDGLDCTL
ncbi:alpha/beta fold hydrolase [Phycicoccus sp. BSK3Z-2]|uniref:Alpha/beta fold hydrolase n=1 Tax=Phycicoccus avicenniae TaxID=2828860 RepID=A0A941D5K3_9MICO|nr:alpha/beta hydrolase [Phycicoccus avicenniae]MBR7741866.1 alpha/beta fold hydrolase [Phycicoccus avicenniae]